MCGAVGGEPVSGTVWGRPLKAHDGEGGWETSRATVASPTLGKHQPGGGQGRGGWVGEETPRRAPAERWMAPCLEPARVLLWLSRSRSIRAHPSTPLTPPSLHALAGWRKGEREEGGRGRVVETLTPAPAAPAVPPLQRRSGGATSPTVRRCQRPSQWARPLTGTVVEHYFFLSWSRRRLPGTPRRPFRGGSRWWRWSPLVLFFGWSHPTAAARGLGLAEELGEATWRAGDGGTQREEPS